MGEEIIGADKEAAIVCYRREKCYASYRKVQGGLATPSRLLIRPECETKLRKATKRSQRLREAASSCHTTGTTTATCVHSAFSKHEKLQCVDSSSRGPCLISCRSAFVSFPPPAYKSEKVMKVNCRRSESEDPDLTAKQRNSNT